MSMIINPYQFGTATDPYFANVISLLHFDGADGSTTFTDEKGLTWTADGNAQLDTALAKFGPSSLLLDRTGGLDRITTPHNANFSADVDFTLEMWVNGSDLAGLRYMATKRNTGTGREWSFYINSAIALAVFDSTGAAPIDFGGTTNLSTGVWYHVAFTREVNTFRLFVNGNLEGSQTASFSYGYNTDMITIGEDPSTAGREFGGHIDDWRVTRGVARYTANFTPPAAPFPNS